MHDVDSILGLLSYLPIRPFQNAYATFLQPAERALIAAHHSPETYELLLCFYTTLFRHWAVKASPQPPRPGSALAFPNQLALSDLAAHVHQMSVSLLLSPPPLGATLTSTILTFYEVLSTSSVPHRVPIVLPPTNLIYLLILAPSTTALSRMAGIIAAYKNAFNKHPTPIKEYYHQDTVTSINCSIRDLYNLIWISRALSVAKDEDGRDKAAGMYCHPSLRDGLNTYLSEIDREYAIQTSFGISNNAWLASLSAFAFRSQEEREIAMKRYDRRSINWHRGPVSQRSLDVLRHNGGVDVDWESYRVEVLKWLEGRGCAGLKEFLFASSDALRKKYL